MLERCWEGGFGLLGSRDGPGGPPYAGGCGSGNTQDPAHRQVVADHPASSAPLVRTPPSGVSVQPAGLEQVPRLLHGPLLMKYRCCSGHDSSLPCAAVLRQADGAPSGGALKAPTPHPPRLPFVSLIDRPTRERCQLPKQAGAQAELTLDILRPARWAQVLLANEGGHSPALRTRRPYQSLKHCFT